MKVLSLILMILIVASCTNRNENPEQVLRDFIDTRFKTNQDMDDLLALATGSFKESLERMQEEDIEIFTKHGMKKRGLDITHSQCTDNTCSITYVLSVDEYSGDTLLNKSELKKIAKLELINGGWKIADITNVKTFHDLKDPIKVSP